MKNDNRAFTIKEMGIILVILLQLSLVGATIWVAWHFISKFW